LIHAGHTTEPSSVKSYIDNVSPSIRDRKFRCIVCSGRDFTFLFQGTDRVHGIAGRFNLFCCNGCGLVFVYPIPDNLDTYYPENYYAFRKKKASLLRSIAAGIKLKTLRTFHLSSKSVFFSLLLYPLSKKYLHYPKRRINKSVERVLDIGCGTGQMLLDLQSLGWEVYGNDISVSACKVARESGLKNIQAGSFEELEYPSGFFDCICMSDTLEHMVNPLSSLRKAKRILRKGGELIIALPNYNSLGRRVFGRHDVIFDLPRHLYMFTPENLASLVKKAGFQTIQIYTTNTISSLHHNFAYMLGIRLEKVQRFDKLINLFDMILECFLTNNKRYGNRLVLKCRS